jgi:hypothetical protein
MHSYTHTLNISILCGQLHGLAALLQETAHCTNQTGDWVGPKATMNAVWKVKTLSLLRINQQFTG